MTWGEGFREVLGPFLELLLLTEGPGNKRGPGGEDAGASELRLPQ